jgi:hypothetical protein
MNGPSACLQILFVPICYARDSVKTNATRRSILHNVVRGYHMKAPSIRAPASPVNRMPGAEAVPLSLLVLFLSVLTELGNDQKSFIHGSRWGSYMACSQSTKPFRLEAPVWVI